MIRTNLTLLQALTLLINVVRCHDGYKIKYFDYRIFILMTQEEVSKIVGPD